MWMIVFFITLKDKAIEWKAYERSYICQYSIYIVDYSVICSLFHASIYLLLTMQVKNLPLTRPNCGKDVRHFEFEFASHVSYPMSLTLWYLYIDV